MTGIDAEKLAALHEAWIDMMYEINEFDGLEKAEVKKIESLATHYLHQTMSNCALTLRKNLDYGDEAINATGAYGLVVRMYDKISRLTNILNRGSSHVKDERTLDTAQDLANYAVIYQMVESGVWGQW